MAYRWTQMVLHVLAFPMPPTLLPFRPKGNLIKQCDSNPNFVSHDMTFMYLTNSCQGRLHVCAGELP
jgi:hypothetical protein